MNLIPFEGGLLALSPVLIEGFCPLPPAIVICGMTYADKLLLLKRHPAVLSAGKWNLPGGKVEKKETLQQAMVREIKEETAIDLDESVVYFVKSIYVRKYQSNGKHDFICHVFKTLLLTHSSNDDPLVFLNREHTDYTWVNLSEAYHLDLISGGEAILRLVFE
ncbi:MAG: NUDIX hydrolase [Candidatus Cardinium sp.]|nr:NUDIX hydrolase [Candidatus Cardinium sp.]